MGAGEATGDFESTLICPRIGASMRSGGITVTWLRLLGVVCVVGAVVAELGGGFGAAASACPGATVHTGVTGTWVSQPVPQFPAGEAGVVDYAIDSGDARKRFVTNGTTIMASTDEGCTFKAVYVIPQTPTPESPYARATTQFSHLAASGGRVIASLTGPPSQESPVTVNGSDPGRATQTVDFLVSSDGGDVWRRPSDRMPRPGEPGDLVFAPSNPKIVYATVGSTLYKSRDAGDSFAVGVPIDPLALTLSTLAVDPLEEGKLFAANSRQLFRSADGGSSWQQYSDADKAASSFVGPVVGREPTGTPRKVTLARTKFQPSGDGSYDGLAVSENGGETFTAIAVGQAGAASGMPKSVIGSSRREELVLTTAGSASGGGAGVFRRSPGSGQLVAVDEFRLAPLTAVTAEPDGKRFHFFSASRLVSFEPPAGDLQPAATPEPRPTVQPAPADGPGGVDAPPVELKPIEEAEPPKSVLAPQAGSVKIDPGETVETEYTLALDPRPLPLDVFFLLDTSGSTDPYIDGLKQGLARLAESLSRAGVSARFGLGEYNDTGGGGGSTRYRRLADIGPPEALGEPLRRIQTAGGSEPGYTAEHQLATGSGIDSGRLPVARGQQANWRTGSVRMVVHIADEPFSADSEGPNRDQTVAALTDRGIVVIGLQVSDLPGEAIPVLVNCGEGAAPSGGIEGDLTPTGEGQLRCMLVDLARQTGAFATRDVDCDGDLVTDVPMGDPLVCTLQGSSVLSAVPDVATPVYELGLSLADRQPASLVAGDTPVTVEVQPGGTYSDLNLHDPHALAFSVRFSCKPEIQGQSFDVPLQARVAGLVAARANPHVDCGKEAAVVIPPPAKAANVPKPKPQPRPVIAPVLPPVAPVGLVPQLPPPAPVTQFQPSQATQPGSAQAQSPAQVQAPGSVPATSAAAATRTEEAPEPILATVEVNEALDNGDSGDIELAFSSYAPARDDDAAWLIRLIGVAGVLGFAGAHARRLRRRARPSHAFAPTRHSSRQRKRNER